MTGVDETMSGGHRDRGMQHRGPVLILTGGKASGIGRMKPPLVMKIIDPSFPLNSSDLTPTGGRL